MCVCIYIYIYIHMVTGVGPVEPTHGCMVRSASLTIGRGGWYRWKPSSSSNFSIRAFRVYALVETGQTGQRRGKSWETNKHFKEHISFGTLLQACALTLSLNVFHIYLLYSSILLSIYISIYLLTYIALSLSIYICIHMHYIYIYLFIDTCMYLYNASPSAARAPTLAVDRGELRLLPVRVSFFSLLSFVYLCVLFFFFSFVVSFSF